MNRCVCIVALCVVLGFFAGPAGAWYPSTPQVEFASATW